MQSYTKENADAASNNIVKIKTFFDRKRNTFNIENVT